MIEKNKILALVQEELDEANIVHPLFHSAHEAQNVIREELEEAEYELEMCKETLQEMWIMIKRDMDYSKSVEELRDRSINLIQETIQVAAMCDKALESMKNYK